MINRLLHRFILLSGILILLVSCDQEITLSAPGESLPVVFAMLNPDDSVHSIRLGRTFKSEGSALDIARSPDSICYEALRPRVELFTESGWKYYEMVFLPVPEMNKEEGIFTGEGTQLYQCKFKLSRLMIRGTRLVLNIQPDSGRTLCSSVISYVDPPKILAPKQGLHTRLDFYPPPLEVRFEDPDEFVRYELHVIFSVLEIMNSGDTVTRLVDKVFIRNSENSGVPRSHAQVIVNVPGDLLLAQVRQVIKPNPDVAYRLPGEIEIQVRTGSPEYYEYMDLNRMAADYGGQVISNITGGVGVFGFRYCSRVNKIFLGMFTMDSLINGHFTRHLGFRGWGD